MKNMTELTEVASQMAMGLLDGTIDVATASEANNTFGKIINAQKTILAYEVVKSQSKGLAIAYLEGSAEMPVLDIKPKPRKLTQGAK